MQETSNIRFKSSDCNESEFQKYYHRYTRYGPEKSCPVSCKKEKLCNLVTSNSKDIASKSIECKEIESMVDQSYQITTKKVGLKIDIQVFSL